MAMPSATRSRFVTAFAEPAPVGCRNCRVWLPQARLALEPSSSSPEFLIFVPPLCCPFLNYSPSESRERSCQTASRSCSEYLLISRYRPALHSCSASLGQGPVRRCSPLEYESSG